MVTRLEIRAPEELDMELVAATLNAFVQVRELHGCDGRLLRSRDGALIVVDPKAYASKRWRFTVAHEIGHLLLHKDASVVTTCTAQDLAAYRTSGYEPEANEFAAELLMPKPLFAPLCEGKAPSVAQVRELASRFATSWTATAIRFVECSTEPCAVVYAEGKRVKWWMRNDRFALPLDRDPELARDSSPETGVRLTHGAAWSDAPNANAVELHEHAIPLRAHDAVLTLLWHRARAN